MHPIQNVEQEYGYFANPTRLFDTPMASIFERQILAWKVEVLFFFKRITRPFHLHTIKHEKKKKFKRRLNIAEYVSILPKPVPHLNCMQ
jgi:hypothetical protein